jgi:CheY-like chemotaxis protein
MSARILIVEDNAANLELMEYLLTAFGYMVLAARDGREGVEMALRERPDLILMDLQLPSVTGFEAARQLRECWAPPRPSIIAVTAFAMVGDRERVMAEGFDGYLSKPITPQTFVTDIEKYLAPARRVERSGGLML